MVFVPVSTDLSTFYKEILHIPLDSLAGAAYLCVSTVDDCNSAVRAKCGFADDL